MRARWLLSLVLPLACAPDPLVRFSTDVPPLILTTASQAGVADARGRFREVLCAVNEHHGAGLPDYRPCSETMVRLADEPPPTGRPVYLGPARSKLRLVTVPGYSWTCIADWLGANDALRAHLISQGYDLSYVDVSAFSSSRDNAREIRDELLEAPGHGAGRDLVLMGHSKGAVDILEAVVAYPELAARVAAVVSVAGAIGGSPLAAEPSRLLASTFEELLRNQECDRGDGRALESLELRTRRRWLAENELPTGVRYYSVVALPDREHVSSLLLPSYDQLSQIDPRNDGQLLFYDQVIPRGSLLGYVNADHWAVAVSIARARPIVASLFVDRNPFPREILLEALVRFVEEQYLEASAR